MINPNTLTYFQTNFKNKFDVNETLSLFALCSTVFETKEIAIFILNVRVNQLATNGNMLRAINAIGSEFFNNTNPMHNLYKDFNLPSVEKLTDELNNKLNTIEILKNSKTISDNIEIIKKIQDKSYEKYEKIFEQLKTNIYEKMLTKISEESKLFLQKAVVYVAITISASVT